jgi:ABC-2 type transport system permease protein
MRLNVVKAVVKKEFYQIIRDKRTLIAAFIFPIMMMFIFSYGISFDVKSIKLAISDADCSVHSRDLIRSLISSGYFLRVSNENLSRKEAEQMVMNGEAAVALVIPHDLARNLKRMKTSYIQILIDGMDSNTANISQGYIKAILLQYNIRIMKNRFKAIAAARGFHFPPINLNLRVWYNPELKSNNFIIPGIIVIIMMMLGAMLTALSIVKEKEFGSFENIVSSPVRGIEFIIGKITPYATLAFLDMALVVLVGWIVFEVPIKGSILILIITSIVYLITALNFGILISTIAKTQQIAMMFALISTMLPSIFFSGFVFPIRSMPLVLQGISLFVPARYFISIIRSIYLKGAGLADFWLDLVILTVFAFILLLASSKRFKKSLD